MNDDIYSGDLHAWIEPEIEARVVALIMGEASDFEAEELERLMEERPEIRIFKRRLESLHGLLGEALAPGDDEDWSLSPANKAELFDALEIEGREEEVEVIEPVSAIPGRERRIRKAGRRVMWSAAACFAITLFIFALLFRTGSKAPWAEFKVADGKKSDGSDGFGGGGGGGEGRGGGGGSAMDPMGLPRSAPSDDDYYYLSKSGSTSEEPEIVSGMIVPGEERSLKRELPALAKLHDLLEVEQLRPDRGEEERGDGEAKRDKSEFKRAQDPVGRIRPKPAITNAPAKPGVSPEPADPVPGGVDRGGEPATAEAAPELVRPMRLGDVSGGIGGGGQLVPPAPVASPVPKANKKFPGRSAQVPVQDAKREIEDEQVQLFNKMAKDGNDRGRTAKPSEAASEYLWAQESGAAEGLRPASGNEKDFGVNGLAEPGWGFVNEKEPAFGEKRQNTRYKFASPEDDGDGDGARDAHGDSSPGIVTKSPGFVGGKAIDAESNLDIVTGVLNRTGGNQGGKDVVRAVDGGAKKAGEGQGQGQAKPQSREYFESESRLSLGGALPGEGKEAMPAPEKKPMASSEPAPSRGPATAAGRTGEWYAREADSRRSREVAKEEGQRRLGFKQAQQLREDLNGEGEGDGLSPADQAPREEPPGDVVDTDKDLTDLTLTLERFSYERKDAEKSAEATHSFGFAGARTGPSAGGTPSVADELVPAEVSKGSRWGDPAGDRPADALTRNAQPLPDANALASLNELESGDAGLLPGTGAPDADASRRKTASANPKLREMKALVDGTVALPELPAEPRSLQRDWKGKVGEIDGTTTHLNESLARLEATLTDSEEVAEALGNEEAAGKSGARELTEAKLKNIVLPAVDFDDVTVEDAIEFIQQRTQELDASELDAKKRNVRFELLGEDEAGRDRISDRRDEDGDSAKAGDDMDLGKVRISGVNLRNVPIETALEEIAEKANLYYSIDANGSVRFRAAAAGDGKRSEDIELRTWDIPVAAWNRLQDGRALEKGAVNARDLLSPGEEGRAQGESRDALQQYGVSFPEGADVTFVASTGKMIVKNTPTNLTRIDALVESSLEQVERERAVKDELEKSAAVEPFSTFSLHVSDVSFKLAKAALERGEWPAAEQVRVEEFVNAFDYGDPAPTQDDKVSCQLEQAAHPFLQQRNLLRVSMRTAALGRAAGTPLRLTVLLDKSGSMERVDRMESIRNAFRLLAGQLQPQDQITLISFARTTRLMADRVAGDKAGELVDLVGSTPSEGGTNLEEALRAGVEKARAQLLEGGQNRIILLTDGAANLGNAKPDDLARLVEQMRQQGIAFDACGVGAEGLNDDILESLTRKGDGRYYFLDRPEDADDGFAKQIAGALRPAAKNVKVQVNFNPERVGRYKLYGFEKHILKKEDFRNDSVDAAELAAEEAGNALYQVEVLPEGEGEIGTVSVRFLDMASGQMVEKKWTIPYDPAAVRLEEAPPSMRLASGAALLGEKLKGSPIGEAVEMDRLSKLINNLQGDFASVARVKELVDMTARARDLAPQ